MKTPIAALAAVALLSVAACDKDKNETKTADTTTVRAADTANGEVKPTTDTVVKTTTTATDTLKGKTADTTNAYTPKKGAKKRTTSKKGY